MTLLPGGKPSGLCITTEFGLAGQLSKLDQRALCLWAEHGAELCDDPRLDELVVEIFESLLQLGTLILELLSLV